MAISSIKDIVPKVATELKVSKAEADTIVKTVLNVMTDSIVGGGFCYKGRFTIKTKEKKERTGSIVRKDPNTGEKTRMEYTSPACTSLGISIGADLKALMNPELNK